MDKKEIREINKLIALFPHQISVEVEKHGDGFAANIITFPGCYTCADTFSELIDMVNDAVRTYFEIPEKYLPFMPDYKPPLILATRLNLFPMKMKKPKKIELEIRDGAKVAC